MLKDELEKIRQKRFEEEAEKIIRKVKRMEMKGKNHLFINNKCLEKEVVELLEKEGLKVDVTSCSARGESVSSTYISW